MKRWFLLVYICFQIIHNGYGQGGKYLGGELETAYTQELKKGWMLNGKLYLKMFWFKDENEVSEESDEVADLNNLRLSFTVARQHSPFFSYGFGYLYGGQQAFTGDFTPENRLFQQVTFSQLVRGKARLSEQIKLEERFFESGNRMRLRGKFAYEMPLQGKNVDLGEWYLLGVYEPLFDLRPEEERNALLYEHRFQVNLGKYTLKQKKIEYGVGYYLSTVSKAGDKQEFWLVRLGIFLN